MSSDSINPVTLFCDGASRGNPGPSSYGFVIYAQNGDILAESGKKLGIVTNNVAEYQGLIYGLKRGLELGAKEIIVKADSQLMIRQLKGEYKVRSGHLYPLFEEARNLLRKYSKSDLIHVRRELNKEADALANEALDFG